MWQSYGDPVTIELKFSTSLIISNAGWVCFEVNFSNIGRLYILYCVGSCSRILPFLYYRDFSLSTVSTPYTRSSLSPIHVCVSINKQLKIIYEILIVILTKAFFK